MSLRPTCAKVRLHLYDLKRQTFQVRLKLEIGDHQLHTCGNLHLKFSAVNSRIERINHMNRDASFHIRLTLLKLQRRVELRIIRWRNSHSDLLPRAKRSLKVRQQKSLQLRRGDGE